ncbi:hypothetical protein PGRAN_09331 [Listeria grandensis FSL F6-0971]|uniref:Uncharacterized protein n=1 Tax=Listeria grandensis FSL F6-0971 TaxID=1265819 RepID=W7BBE9_9LIST|nr:hypothetical protein PGRAN_09331 [Listeria grandensis FSL F6-0971]
MAVWLIFKNNNKTRIVSVYQKWIRVFLCSAKQQMIIMGEIKLNTKKTTEEKGGTSVVKKGVLRIFIQKGENEGSLVVVSLYSYNTDYEGKPAVS